MSGEGGVLTPPSIDCRVSVADVYERVAFPAT
jgi:hypothetical protein